MYYIFAPELRRRPGQLEVHTRLSPPHNEPQVDRAANAACTHVSDVNVVRTPAEQREESAAERSLPVVRSFLLGFPEGPVARPI